MTTHHRTPVRTYFTAKHRPIWLAKDRTNLSCADLVIAYINEPDCYGALVDIGQALALNKRLVVITGPTAPLDRLAAILKKVRVDGLHWHLDDASELPDLIDGAVDATRRTLARLPRLTRAPDGTFGWSAVR